MSEHRDIEHHAVSLVASEHSKITNISLYSGRAEITRLFKLKIKAGQSKITVLDLPWSLKEESIRVEGRGNASIHDVVISKAQPPPRTTTPLADSHAKNPLKRRKEELESEAANTQRVRSALNNFLGIVNDRAFEASQLESTLDTYMTLARKIGIRILDIEKELLEVVEQLKQEEKKNCEVPFTPSWQVSIDVHNKVDETVRIYLKYVVSIADWSASYDIRIDTQSKQKAATIIYKAVITQNTGESWDDAPLTLETVKPSFGIKLPKLSSWHVMPVMPVQPMPQIRGRTEESVAYRRSYSLLSRSPRRRARRSSVSPRRRSRSRSFSRSPDHPALMHQTFEVSNKGGIVATFRVPGVINIPSDGGKHNVTITQLSLDADLMWFAIPAVDTRAHLKAKIKNNSEYSFIPGPANIYVDGSFVATTSISSISPQEVFECPLGLDNSIRFTYHPREKKSAQSGFYSKTSTQSYTQRITIVNTKSVAIKNIKLVDCIPISEDERIEVKLISPPLTLPATKASSKLAAAVTASQTTLAIKPAPSAAPAWLRPVRISENVTAQWDGIDEPGAGLTAAGKNGKFNWLVSAPSQTSVSLVLQFEVSSPENLAIQGL